MTSIFWEDKAAVCINCDIELDEDTGEEFCSDACEREYQHGACYDSSHDQYCG